MSIVEKESRQVLADQGSDNAVGIEYRWRHTVEWGECDPAGIVFYPNFYRWFDASSHQLMTRHGFGQTAMISRYGIVGFALIDSGAKFIRPVRWEDNVVVCSRIENYSRKTMTVQHEIYADTELSQLCVNGFEVRIWGKIDAESGVMKAWELPEEFTRLLG